MSDRGRGRGRGSAQRGGPSNYKNSSDPKSPRGGSSYQPVGGARGGGGGGRGRGGGPPQAFS